MKYRLLLTLAVLFMIVSFAAAIDFMYAGVDDVKAVVDKKSKTVIADARPQEEYKQGHIPKAINLSEDRLGSLEKMLPKDKKRPIIIYCRGYG